MNAYVARQPIFDKDVNVYAYELLFRSNSADNFFTGLDADMASSKTITDSFYTMGIDKITGGKKAFINFTETLLLEGVATLFPKDILVVEVLEDVVATPKLILVCLKLRKMGYRIALDDFVYDDSKKALINICNIIKFDFLLSTPAEIKEAIDKLGDRKIMLLAEKIETNEMFLLAKKMGFVLFQGHFFSKPVILEAKEVSPLKLNYLLLIKELSGDKNLDYDKLASIIKGDVALTYKLLRLVNYVLYSQRAEIFDIKQALIVLGTEEIRKWISLLAMAGLEQDKPDEIIRLSMVRARFLELCGKRLKLNTVMTEMLFLAGLFSLIDVLTDMEMNAVIETIAVAPEIKDALALKRGVIYVFLSLIYSIENGDWDEVDRIRTHMKLSESAVSELYVEAVDWGTKNSI